MGIASSARIAVTLAALLLVGACSSSTSSADSASPQTTTSTTVPRTARFFDRGANSDSYSADFPSLNDVTELMQYIDVVFVGKLTGTEFQVAAEGARAGDPYLEYDGITFNVDEVLVSELQEGQVVVAHPAALIFEESGEEFGVQVEPIVSLRSGILSAESGRTAVRYLIFANYFRFPGGEFLTFFGEDSVAQLSPDGSAFVPGAILPVVTKEGQYLYGEDVTLDVIRELLAD